MIILRFNFDLKLFYDGFIFNKILFFVNDEFSLVLNKLIVKNYRSKFYLLY